MTDELKQWEYDKGYTKGYSDGRASLVEELEKIREEIEKDIADLYYPNDTRYGLGIAIEIIDKHIKENNNDS